MSLLPSRCLTKVSVTGAAATKSPPPVVFCQDAAVIFMRLSRRHQSYSSESKSAIFSVTGGALKSRWLSRRTLSSVPYHLTAGPSKLARSIGDTVFPWCSSRCSQNNFQISTKTSADTWNRCSGVARGGFGGSTPSIVKGRVIFTA